MAMHECGLASPRLPTRTEEAQTPMTEQPPPSQRGLSIFESPAAATPPADPAPARPTGAASSLHQGASSAGDRAAFPVVRRGGYDRSAVDAYVASTSTDAQQAAEAGRQEVVRLRDQVADLEHRLAESETPTYAGLGGRAATVLRLAQEEADAVRSRAQQAADESRSRILHEAAALRADAEKEAEDIRSVQMVEIDERRSSVLAEAEQERSLAQAEAQDILASANREAEQLRLAAQQEVNSLRTTAKREAEQLRAAADRETMEAGRMLAVEKERLTKEAADRHSTAVAETDLLVTEAESRANGAEARAREAIAASTKHRQQATTESERTLARSRREAEQIVTAARKQAQQIVANAQADADRQQAATVHDLEALQARRDGIVAQLGQLQDVLRSFAGPGDAPATPAQEAPDSEEGQS